MNPKLKNDIDRFCHIYQQNIEEILKSKLPYPVQKELDAEFQLFKESLYHRLNEEFR